MAAAVLRRAWRGQGLLGHRCETLPSHRLSRGVGAELFETERETWEESENTGNGRMQTTVGPNFGVPADRAEDLRCAGAETGSFPQAVKLRGSRQVSSLWRIASVCGRAWSG